MDETIPALVVVWKRYATSTQLRYILEAMLIELEKRGLAKILGDDTALPIIHSSDQEWIVHDWMPRAIRAGLRAAASKSPTALFGKISVSSVQSHTPHPLVIRSFGARDEARLWLASV